MGLAPQEKKDIYHFFIAMQRPSPSLQQLLGLFPLSPDFCKKAFAMNKKNFKLREKKNFSIFCVFHNRYLYILHTVLNSGAGTLSKSHLFGPFSRKPFLTKKEERVILNMRIILN
jgi:hypothetical protein